MRTDVSKLIFTEREEFRVWLQENAKTSDGVWLVFGKIKDVVTLSANDALEEALCFGWIDGQMKRTDDTKYLKYFARRRNKSHWSEKNKMLVGTLRERKLMTELGEKAVETAMRNGTWDSQKGDQITDEEVEAFTEKLRGISPAYENFKNMSRSVRFTYTRRYYSFKSEEARERDFEKIVERLSKNMKPM
jgi:uncharacterized protein YdeI (YjbR/CyaY-like superfamily)